MMKVHDTLKTVYGPKRSGLQTLSADGSKLLTDEPHHEKTNVLHMRKQRRISASLFSLHR